MKQNLLENDLSEMVEVSEGIQLFRRRIGQNQFSKAVRLNYNSQCCFPGCTISHEKFLVGSHIARWVDVPELRGHVSNGLCLCLMHDKAFEQGYFTLNKNFNITVNWNYKDKFDQWLKTNLDSFNGYKISLGNILPSMDALKHHWERIQFDPNT